MEESKPTYEIVKNKKEVPIGMKCLLCGYTSYNQNDLFHKFCYMCKVFHDDLKLEKSQNFETGK